MNYDGQSRYANPNIQYDDFFKFEEIMEQALKLPKNSTSPIIIVNTFIKYYPAMQIEWVLPASVDESVIMFNDMSGKLPRLLCKLHDTDKDPDKRTEFEEALVQIIDSLFQIADKITIKCKFKPGSIDRIKHLPQIQPLTYEDSSFGLCCFNQNYHYNGGNPVLYVCGSWNFFILKNQIITSTVGILFEYTPYIKIMDPEIKEFIYEWFMNGKKMPILNQHDNKPPDPVRSCLNFIEIILRGIAADSGHRFHNFLIRGLYDPRLLCLIFAFV